MIISHKYQFIFVKTAKTAGTSIEIYLSKFCSNIDVATPFAYPEPEHEPRNYRGLFNPFPEIKKGLQIHGFHKDAWIEPIRDLRHRRRFSNHLPGWRIRSRIHPDMWKNYYKFCVERNPYSKILSGWRYFNWKYKTSFSLDAYLKYCADQIQNRKRGIGSCPYNFPNYTDPVNNTTIVDRILRYEMLNDDLASVFYSLNIPFDKALPVRAKTLPKKKQQTIQDVFTPHQRATVAALFKEEFKLHGYTFED